MTDSPVALPRSEVAFSGISSLASALVLSFLQSLASTPLATFEMVRRLAEADIEDHDALVAMRQLPEDDQIKIIRADRGLTT